MTIEQVSIPLAIAAGLVSFLSPCVLPLVPAYLAFLARGTETAEPALAGGPAAPAVTFAWRRLTLLNAVAFVAGLSVVFVLLFYALRTVLTPFRALFIPVAGALVIMLALQTAGLIRIPFLMREYRVLKEAPARAGPRGGFLLGLAFATGWTPCIGTTLGAVLTSGVAQGTTGAGLVLMVAYCVGLGVPFLVLALAIERAVTFTRLMNRHRRGIDLASAAVLLAMGLLLLTNNLLLLTQAFARVLPAVPFGL
ncbi:MAG: cytochrome c biogenesis CcdA family protein [Candidatus Dormibacteraceae bacterium]